MREALKMTDEQIREACNEICLQSKTEEEAESGIREKLGLGASIIFVEPEVPGQKLFMGTVDDPREMTGIINFGN